MQAQIDKTLALSWSGGKDSALALLQLRGEGVQPAMLITTVTEGYERISMHGVRRSLLHAQASALGIALVEVEIPIRCDNETYERRFDDLWAQPQMQQVETVAFGDLFLADIRSYREGQLKRCGRTARFPIWGIETDALARRFIAVGFSATLVCVDLKILDRSFSGRKFDAGLLADLPGSVDPCGENGEFHTFVDAGPIFSGAVQCTRGAVEEREGFAFCDLIAPI